MNGYRRVVDPTADDTELLLPIEVVKLNDDVVTVFVRGEVPHHASALAHAPHTAEDVLVAEWDRPYSREQAAYPLASLRHGKYWPPVSRIDGGYGDRNLMCACPPPEAFED